jgi:serine phosphatase RsbU (regulator of sigma subunit)
VLPPGSQLILFSDGAFETVTLEGRIRGLADVLPALVRPPEPGRSELDRLIEAAQQGARPGFFEDDVSLICLDFA